MTNISLRQKLADYAFPLILCLSDYTAIILAESLSYALRKFWLPMATPTFHIPAIYLFIIVPAIFMCFLQVAGKHVRRVPVWKIAQNVFWATFYAILIIVILMYFARVSAVVSRLFVAMTWFFSFVFIVLFRYGLKKYVNAHNIFSVPVLFVGAGLTAELVLKAFDGGGFGYNVIGFVDDHPVSQEIAKKYRILGGFNNIEKIIRRTGVRSVIITAPGLSPLQQVELVNRIQPLVKSVSFVPDFMGAPVTTMDVESLFDERIIFLKVRNNLARWQNRLIKRVFDIICCLCGLIFVLPICVAIGIMIKLDSDGPIFYTHRRIGRGGKEFDCYKFRSMYINGDAILKEHLQNDAKAREEWEKFAKIRGEDPRVTKFGKVIRRYSLDELPQVFNVILGDMSLVGPRPYMLRERSDMGDYFDTITTTVPGITGLWQTSGRNDLSFKDRLRLDAWYVRNWSMWLDLSYLLKTIGVVLKSKGAY